MRFHCGFSFNWKTLKKWIIPILIGILLLFSQKLVVNAESISDVSVQYLFEEYKYSNSNNWNAFSTNYFTIGGGLSLNFHFKGNVTFPTSTNNITNQYLYGRIYLCSDQSMSAGWSPDNSATNVWFYNTNIPCNYYNSTYANGKLWIGNYKYFPIFYNGVGSFDFYVNTYFDNTASIQIYSNIMSLNQFEPYAYESGSYKALQEILNVLSSQNSQNSTIINNQQQIINGQNNINNGINDVNDSINDVKDSITDSSLADGTSGGSFFGDGIWNQNYGISSILTIPINFINSITSKTCSPLVLDLPFLNNKTITLPCISNLIETNFKPLFDVYQLVIGGFIILKCILTIFKDVEQALNPESDFSISGYFV